MRSAKSTAVQDAGTTQEMAVRPPPRGSMVTGVCFTWLAAELSSWTFSCRRDEHVYTQ